MPNGKQREFLYARAQSPYWWYKFILNGERFRGSTGCTEASDAAVFVEAKRVEARAALQARHDAVGHIGDGTRQLTLSQCLERYHQAKEDGWRNKRCRRINAEYCLAIGEGPNMLITDLTLSDLTRFRAQRKKMVNRKGEPLKDTTINRDLAHLRSAIRYASKCHFAVPQIDWGEAIKTKAERNRTRTLSAGEEGRLFAAIDKLHPDLRGPVQFAIWSGARKSAVFGLMWANIDFEDCVAHIELKAEGDTPVMHEVPLTDGMMELIMAQPQVTGCAFVFTYECRRGDKRAGLEKGKRYPWTEHGIYKPWNAVVSEAGLRDFRFHDLRHTGATRLVRAVPNLELARQLLGHADIKTTQKYANVDREDVRAAMNLVGKRPLQALAGGKP